MGCDIHMYREKNVNGKWLSCDEFEDIYEDGDLDVPYDKRFSDRNYNLFGILSKGVRREFDFSFVERGLPLNVSSDVLNANSRWGGDGHSHSYLYLNELKDLNQFIKNTTIPVSGQKDETQLKTLRESIDSKDETNWDLLYPYCQWSSMDTDIDFNIDVPASFIIGDSLTKIIKMFDGEKGDNHRIVFWFDN